jgi:hypothetical protein
VVATAQPWARSCVAMPVQPVSRTRWRALPTAIIVIGAIALGAATAKADPAPAHAAAAASTSAAIR